MGVMDTNCEIATGYKDHGGYGRVSQGRGHSTGAHRVAWVKANGPIPEGFCVLHRCDNPPCIRIEHLFLGTHAENMRDMYAKGRRDPGRKLTDGQVREIREHLASGVTGKALAEQHGVSVVTISNIKRGHRYTSVM